MSLALRFSFRIFMNYDKLRKTKEQKEDIVNVEKQKTLK